MARRTTSGLARTIGWLGAAAGAALAAVPAAADVRLDPVQVGLSLGVAWLLLGAGLLALAAGITFVWGLLRKSRPPSGRGRRGIRIAALAAALGWLMSFAVIMLQPRRSNATEANAIGGFRTIISAQEAYRAANGGFFEGKPACYSHDAPSFLDAQLMATPAVKWGYRRAFHPGRPADPAAIQKQRASASSVQSYAYTAVPVEAGRSGVRGFCGDSAGIICYTADGSLPLVVEGACVVGADARAARPCVPLAL